VQRHSRSYKRRAASLEATHADVFVLPSPSRIHYSYFESSAAFTLEAARSKPKRSVQVLDRLDVLKDCLYAKLNERVRNCRSNQGDQTRVQGQPQLNCNTRAKWISTMSERGSGLPAGCYPSPSAFGER
jgi:hypothetical protein